MPFSATTQTSPPDADDDWLIMLIVALTPSCTTPTISQVTNGQPLYAGQSVTLSVACRLSPFSYQWRANGVAIPSATSATITTNVPSDSNITAVAFSVVAVAANRSSTVSTTFRVLAAPNQSITFAPLSPRLLSDSPIVISANASSGLPVSFSTPTPTICSVTGTTVTLLAAGACEIIARQSGNATFTSAAEVSRSFDIAVAATIPGAPSIGLASAGNAQAIVNFIPPTSNGGSPITNYSATCGTQNASAAISPIAVTGLTNGTAVSCTVRAVNIIGSSAASAASNVVTPAATVPGAPTALSAIAGNASAVVTFSAPAGDGGSPITNYSATCGAQNALGVTSPIAVTGLANGTAVACTVRAVNVIGSSAASVASNAVTPTASVPGAPTALNATAGNASALVTFTAPASDGGSAITGYKVSCNPSGIFATGTVSPITVMGLANGTAYTCSVTATNAFGTGAASATVGVTPVAPPPSPPQVNASFNPTDIGANGTTKLTIVVTNNSDIALNGITFTNPYPAGLLNSATPNPLLSGFGCSGNLAVSANGTNVALSGGIVPPYTSCKYSVEVKATALGTIVNAPLAVTGTAVAVGTAPSITLTVHSLLDSLNGIKAALNAADMTAAKSYFKIGVRDTFAPILDKVRLRGATAFFDSLSSPQQSGSGQDYIEFAVRRVVGGQTYTFFIYYTMDEDGIWRIESM